MNERIDELILAIVYNLGRIRELEEELAVELAKTPEPVSSNEKRKIYMRELMRDKRVVAKFMKEFE